MHRAWKFGRHDRIVLDGAHYRAHSKANGRHVLQAVVGEILRDHFVTLTDEQVTEHMRGPLPRMRVDEGFYSKALAVMRCEHDSSDISVFSDEEQRNVAWRTEWVRRFHARRLDPERPKLSLTMADLAVFVEEEKEHLGRWYIDRFGLRRPPGRRRAGEQLKLVDHPSASGLYKWINRYRTGGQKKRALASKYDRCGRRDQLDPRLLPLMHEAVEFYCTPLKPLVADVQERVRTRLVEINKELPPEERIRVSQKAVSKRIREIDPFIADARRDGLEKAIRKYSITGYGQLVNEPLERIEIDDWEADLLVLLQKAGVWKRMTTKQRKMVPRIRATVTVAIDVRTRCIVGLWVSPRPPSTVGSKAALRRTLIDKTPLAKWAECESDWPMRGRGATIVTDGGPVFQGEFEDAVERAGCGRVLPHKDARMRGTIEAFFRTFRRFCRLYAGRTFSNVVERGEYPAVEMASVTFEEFHQWVIRFVVDWYHHRPHRGLEGATPYNTWMKLAAKGMRPDITGLDLALAFGNHDNEMRTVQNSGVEVFGGFYSTVVEPRSPDGTDTLVELFKALPEKDRRVKIVIDPNDMGTILVQIPKQLRGRKNMPEGHYVRIGTKDGEREGITLEDLLLSQAELRDIVTAEGEDCTSIHLRAASGLFETSRETMKRAGINPLGVTNRELRHTERMVAFKSKAGTTKVAHSETPKPVLRASFGKVVATPAPTAERRVEVAKQQPAKRPFDGGMNTYGDDE